MLLAILTVATCVDPSMYGAVPDDRKSDTEAIQKAIDAAVTGSGKVCLGKGVFHVERTRELGSLMITRGPLELYGTGSDTVIRMSGSGKRDDWRAFEIKGARKIYLHDFVIDGLDAFDGAEQTHLIEIAAGTSDVTINRMTFGPMRRPDQRIGEGIGGDCIRLLGKRGAEVVDVSITNSTFVDCDRSGIAFQRALKRILIAHTKISGTGDAAIDFEPTGKGDIQDVVMLDLTITHSPDAQGSIAVSIGGHGEDLAHRITLADSKIIGGGIKLLNVADVHILRNTIDYGAGKKIPTIGVMRRGTGVVISKNTITRPASAAAGPIIRAEHNHGHMPRNLTVENNILQQETAAPVIATTSVSGVVVRRNKIRYTGSDPRVSIVNVTAVIGDVDNVSVTDNEIEGDAGAVLSVRARDRLIKTVELRANKAPRTPTTVHCQGKAAGYAAIRTDDGPAARSACKGVQIAPIRTPSTRTP
jgi:hypothetical protein